MNWFLQQIEGGQSAQIDEEYRLMCVKYRLTAGCQNEAELEVNYWPSLTF